MKEENISIDINNLYELKTDICEITPCKVECYNCPIGDHNLTGLIELLRSKSSG